MSKKDNLKRTIPALFKPSVNPNWKALLDSYGEGLDDAVQAVQDAKEQLFVLTAVGKFLEALGDNYGVKKFDDILIQDAEFRQLIKILSFKPKQIKATIEELLNLFFNNSPLVIVKEINPNELIIQMPANVPVIVDRLIGSHHFHASTTESDWTGSYFYNPGGGITYHFSADTTLNQTITAGDFGGLTAFIDSSLIPDAPGYLVFDFGTDNEEGPVPYISRPNNSSLVIDPGYQFTKSHAPGAVTLLADNVGHEPVDTGLDYAVFNVSIQQPRITAQEQVIEMVAAGVVIRFILIEPENSCIFA